ncbi:dTDP-4-dehydrorhamnose 3,5-epimerase [Candidatus Parcubacteria bacterium]|nr:dTDP-4-dehydrorhamnose 3,5-epimerase [Candidatus Parcubacteria bacterium]
MKIIPTKLKDLYIIEPDVFSDERGLLTKPFHKNTFVEHGLVSIFEESFFSISKKNVIRGMHFQIPNQDHAKLVYVPSGAILDAVVDLRTGSPTYGQYETVELSSENHRMIYIPSGFAHGFLALKDNSCTTYLQSTMRSAEHEGGIRFDSFGFNWPVAHPIVSKRDQEFPSLAEFKSPFIYKA